MKKQTKLFSLINAFPAVFQTQSVTATNYTAYLPEMALTATANTTSNYESN